MHENGVISQEITEGESLIIQGSSQDISPPYFPFDEVALYDRQIRLWGMEAQQKMRNATIFVINLRGVGTETIKNIVLSGIGKLIVLDTEDVQEEDLGAGFFFRDDDVGKKRVDAAKPRIESLNPLVTVEAISDSGSSEWWDSTVTTADIVCLTDGSREELGRINELCRKLQKPFYSGGTHGLTGYIFCDLLTHEYISFDRTAGTGDQTKAVKHTVVYPSLSDALKHDWKTLTKKQCKHQNAELVFSIFALWEYQRRHKQLPTDTTMASDLQSIANSQISHAQINSQVLSSVPIESLESLASMATHEFSPVCAVVGGFLGQDLLKALGGRDPPIANLFVFDGNTGSGAVSRLHMQN